MAAPTPQIPREILIGIVMDSSIVDGAPRGLLVQALRDVLGNNNAVRGNTIVALLLNPMLTIDCFSLAQDLLRCLWRRRHSAFSSRQQRVLY